MELETFSGKQLQIFDFMYNDKNYLICDGAVRSGKTVCMSIAFVLWAMSHTDGATYAICGKTVANAERNVVVPFMSIAGFRDKVRYRRQERCMIVSINNRVNYFYVFGGKDESSYALIQGITLAGALLDEAALMPRSFVEQCMARTITYEDKKIWFNCNPENRLHWLNTEWIEPIDAGQRPDAVHLHFMMEDNPIMTPAAIEQAKGMFSGVFYKRYILGMWVMAEGLIYDMWDESQHVLQELPETEGDYFVSSDFGIQNATTFLLWRRERGSHRWICLREYYYSGREAKRQKTVEELVTDLQGMLGGVIPRQVIVDPSAAALIVALRKAGYHTASAVNDVIDGISDVSTLLRYNEIGIYKDCRMTIEEFSIYAWDSKAAERGEDRPIKENDHCMDAVRYFVKTRQLVRRINKNNDLHVSGFY